MERRRERLRVLLSVRGPAPTTNPYVVQLARATTPACRVEFFTWTRGLSGRYDVLHVHWPEVMIRRAGRAARWAARLRFAGFMAVVTARRIPVVRTLHNVETHEAGTAVERLLLRWCERRTRRWILLNPDTPLPRTANAGVPREVILHGHYVDWFARFPPTPAMPGRLVMFGLIRPYKGTEALLAAFAALPDPDARLRIVGRPTTEPLRAVVTAAAERDPRIGALLDYVDDATLAAEVGRAQLVVLPYRDLHNSGALLLALSLGRPALVPRTSTTDALAAEVGAGWVRRYDSDLTAADLAAALRVPTPAGRPDLRARDWRVVGEQHVRAYEASAGWARGAGAAPSGAGVGEGTATGVAVGASGGVVDDPFAAGSRDGAGSGVDGSGDAEESTGADGSAGAACSGDGGRDSSGGRDFTGARDAAARSGDAGRS